MEKSAFRQYATLFRVRFLAGLQYRAAALAGDCRPSLPGAG